MEDYHKEVRDGNGTARHEFQKGKYIKVVARRIITFPATALGVIGGVVVGAVIGYHFYQKYKNA
ncbi:MAG: hypothetical protein JWM92_63 [Candidatus Nomurabacteria bacterium]|nr:hypothetical protein [Candidatus Nomurabacteria bacterium]